MKHFDPPKQGAILGNHQERRMSRGNASGIKVSQQDLPIIMAMIARKDRHHDIAAWFGLNQGRIKDAQDGKYGPPKTNPTLPLPPKGPPGIKGRHLRNAVEAAITALHAGDISSGIDILEKAISNYDTDEA